jgi:predicted nucleotidyltransferase
MSTPGRSIPASSPASKSSPLGTTLATIRDRDYLLDRAGMIFKVIVDVHPGTHFLGYVKYYPDDRGDRMLFGRTFRQNSLISKAFGLLADRPECYLYSPAVGCVITGVPREDIVTHYSCRQTLAALHQNPDLLDRTAVSEDLLVVINWIVAAGAADAIGVTGSFLVGACNARSDIDLVCYRPRGYEAAQALFTERTLIRPYEGETLTRLYARRAKYMVGGSSTRSCARKPASYRACEPLRADGDKAFAQVVAKEVGAISVLARITDHSEGLVTPALYGIEVETVTESTVDEPSVFARRITHLRSYLGAYTGAFRTGDVVYLSGRLVHIKDPTHTAASASS